MAEKDNSGFGWRGISGSTLVGLGAADLRHSKWRGKAMILTGAATLLTPSKASAAEPGKPAAPLDDDSKARINNIVGGVLALAGTALLARGGRNVHRALKEAVDPMKSSARGALQLITGAAQIPSGAVLVKTASDIIADRRPQQVGKPSGPAGPIGATGNAPGGPAPAQDTGPGLLTKAAVHIASALPQTAPVVQAIKDPETTVRLGVGALGTASTIQAARMLSPAARVGAKLLTKALLPLTAALAVKDGIDGYQKDGVKGAALGVADSLTGGLLSLGLEKAGVIQPAGQPVAPQTPQAVVSDRLGVARQAAERTTGEMGRTETLNKGSTAPANTEVNSDGMTDDYFRTQNGRQVRVSGYTTPSR